MKSGDCTVYDDGDGDIMLETPYDEDFKEKLKDLVPYTHRKWMPKDACWWIEEKYAKKAIRLAAEFFNVAYDD